MAGFNDAIGAEIGATGPARGEGPLSGSQMTRIELQAGPARYLNAQLASNYKVYPTSHRDGKAKGFYVG